MIRSHSDDYRPPRDRRPLLLSWLCAVTGAGVVIAGLVWLAVRFSLWLLK